MTTPNTTPTTHTIGTAAATAENWAVRRGLAAWLPARCRCGTRADLVFGLVIATNGALQVRLRCTGCSATGESVPHVHCDRCAALTLWPLSLLPGAIVGACPLCLNRPDEALTPRKP